jgi:periplasmic divalent cation tolerance protein
MTSVVLVLTTVPSDNRGDELARTLVDERLAACVNIYPPMVSLYRWHGKVERDEERQIVIKTSRDRVQALEARIKELHSYELPEFIVLGVTEGSEGYLEWVAEEASPVPSPKP